MTGVARSTLAAASGGAIALGAAADRLIGDPRRLPHLVRGIGSLIAATEKCLRRRPAHSARQERRRGTGLVVTVLAVAGLGSLVPVLAAYSVSVWAGIAVETLLCCQCLAVKSLRDESGLVRADLINNDLIGARRDVGRIVGRDTAELDEQEVIRAAVETVAENTADGVVAPLLAMMVAGGVGGVVYKAVNTMDSMVGYRNERYCDFGRAAARLDDAVNWLPSRLSAGLMIAAAYLTGEDWRGAWRIWRRDRSRHPSPNSAQTEAACAGALGVQLGGPASYGGVVHDKPTLGDSGRPLAADDIDRANRLMSTTGWLALASVVACRLAVWGVVRHVSR